MTAKRVWGIVLIILSVVFVLSGLSHYHELTTIDGLLQTSVASVPQQYRSLIWTSGEARFYAATVRNEKVLSIISALLGLCMAAAGTSLLKDYPRSFRLRFLAESENADLEVEELPSGRFKL